MDLDYLSSLGVRICLQGHHPAMAAIQAVYKTLKALREGARPANLEGIPDKVLINRYTRIESYDRWIKEFLE